LERQAIDEERGYSYEMICPIFVEEKRMIGRSIENISDGKYFKMVGANWD